MCSHSKVDVSTPSKGVALESLSLGSLGVIGLIILITPFYLDCTIQGMTLLKAISAPLQALYPVLQGNWISS